METIASTQEVSTLFRRADVGRSQHSRREYPRRIPAQPKSPGTPSVRRAGFRVVLISVLICVLALGACLLLIRPDPSIAVHGLSYYGTRSETVVLFAIALLAVATCSWASASLISGPRWWPIVFRANRRCW